MKKRSLRLLALVALAGGLSFASGCIVTEDVYYGDIEVDWTIEGVADSSAACDAYGIDHWVVEVTGPEVFDLTYDCYNDAWFTDTDLWDVEEGTYNISVVAVDIDGFELAALSDTADSIDDGGVDQLGFDFIDSDFP